jgi:hypothetical protein
MQQLPARGSPLASAPRTLTPGLRRPLAPRLPGQLRRGLGGLLRALCRRLGQLPRAAAKAQRQAEQPLAQIAVHHARLARTRRRMVRSRAPPDPSRDRYQRADTATARAPPRLHARSGLYRLATGRGRSAAAATRSATRSARCSKPATPSSRSSSAGTTRGSSATTSPRN